MGKLLKPPGHEPTNFHGLITVSPQMRQLFSEIEKASASSAPVLLRGETGTGKELVARALHRLSRRFRGPFRALNCATLTHEMLASELFGHIKGAFTGATRSRKGLFELADGGTLFLDEIAELPLDLQARLLRVIEQRSFVPLGGTEQVSVDVRLLSATHRSLRHAVDEGRFRADLMFRLRVVPIFLPRLAEREGDIEALTWHFISVFNGRGPRRVEAVDSEAMDALEAYDWPGNVRELSNVIEYAFVMGDGEVLTLDELTPELREEPPPVAAHRQDDEQDEERRELIDALERAHGKKTKAADLLGISRTTLWRKLKEHQIDDW
jgi:two-component system response regulator AtoC